MNSIIEAQQEFLSQFSPMGMRMCNYYKNVFPMGRIRDFEREKREDEQSVRLTMNFSTQLLDIQRRLV